MERLLGGKLQLHHVLGLSGPGWGAQGQGTERPPEPPEPQQQQQRRHLTWLDRRQLWELPPPAPGPALPLAPGLGTLPWRSILPLLPCVPPLTPFSPRPPIRVLSNFRAGFFLGGSGHVLF